MIELGKDVKDLAVGDHVFVMGQALRDLAADGRAQHRVVQRLGGHIGTGLGGAVAGFGRGQPGGFGQVELASGFGLALVLGGQEYATAEVEIYTLVAHELQLGQAGVLSLWMLALTAIVAWGYAFMERRLATPARADAIPRRRPQGWAAWVRVVAVVLIWMLICAAPLVSIARGAMNSGAISFGA